ncbi:MAG: radical SAM protein [Candidatus Bathyarchaeota archaeon]|nr:radical SAM protein [Candidatus Bathyarchaeota archaeon]MDH5788038.1 radical SAM protein [Candidatus Bathyarchaeota archaeon]
MSLISKFDPWHSALCTCPPKLTFNPYTGCDHHCIYCYASSYIPRFFNCRPKKDLIPKLKKEAAKLKGEIISIANSSDPYPNVEAETGLTRKCLEILSCSNCRIQIITKSTLVTRDIDLLTKVPSMVSVTITTDDNALAKLIEPHAPPPSKRLKTIEELLARDIPVSVRIDPIIPFLNDDPQTLIKNLADIGIKHVTASTYKTKPGNWQRLSTAFPKTAEKLKPLYFQKGEKISRYSYLPKDFRHKIMNTIRIATEKRGIRFGTCRENLSHLNTATCDGSWLLSKTNNTKS